MVSETKIPVWLDCDPGHDDAFAILLVSHHASIQPLGISTVHGNASISNTTYNALSLLTSMSSTQIPVFAGASSGLSRPPIHAGEIHGASGLDGTRLLPVPSVKAQESDAIEAMSAALRKTLKNTAWVVATGALTNVAKLFIKYPELIDHVKGVSIMGGAIGNGFTNAKLGAVNGVPRMGNWSVHAEFNILADPEAAAAILENPTLCTKTVMIPLDVTHLVLGTKEVQQVLLKGKDGKPDTRLRKMLVELLTYFATTYAEMFDIVEGPPLHDPLAVAVILDQLPGSEIPFHDYQGERKRERYRVKVVTDGTHEDARNGAETGRTIVELLPEGEDGVRIPRGLNVKNFWKILGDCLVNADAVNATNGLL